MIIVLGALYLAVGLLVALFAFFRWRKQRQPPTLASLEENAMPAVPSVPVLGVPASERAASWSVYKRAQAPSAQPVFDLSSIERSIKMGFVRKVYCILATQIGLTVAITLAMIYAGFELDNGCPDPARPTELTLWVVQQYWVTLVLFVPTLLLLCCMHNLKNRYPYNFGLLFLFTALESVQIGCVCLLYYLSLIHI